MSVNVRWISSLRWICLSSLLVYFVVNGFPAVCLGAVAEAAVPDDPVVEAPAPVQELMPSAPSGTHVWVTGSWERESEGWVWTAGRWTVLPFAGARWVPGHFAQSEREGWRWLKGHWAVAEPGWVVPTPLPVPERPNDVKLRRPGEEYVWLAGRWEWVGDWRWYPGHWVEKPAGDAVWVDGFWDRYGESQSRWVPGHWRVEE